VKLFTLILFLVFFLSSCDRTNKQIAARIKDADSAAINYFTGDGKMDSVRLVKIIRDKKQLDQLAGFISAVAADDQQCGFDGSIHFFKTNKVMQDIDFRMNDAQCMYFRFKVNGKYSSTRLSPEARQLLQSISK
jgi:hypothetical protein